MQAKTYSNVIELYEASEEFREAFNADTGRGGLQGLINYFDDYSDKPDIVARVLSDVIDRGRWKFKCLNRKAHWRKCKIEITMVPSYWTSPVGGFDDFGAPIKDIVIDAKTKHGPWALMTPETYAVEGNRPGVFGLGVGQKYQKQADGRWLKIEG